MATMFTFQIMTKSWLGSHTFCKSIIKKIISLLHNRTCQENNQGQNIPQQLESMSVQMSLKIRLPD